MGLRDPDLRFFRPSQPARKLLRIGALGSPSEGADKAFEDALSQLELARDRGFVISRIQSRRTELRVAPAAR